MRYPRSREAEVVAVIRRDSDACLVFPKDDYRPDGSLIITHHGVQQLLHRRLYTLLIGPLGKARLERTCDTYGCANPHHFALTRELRATRPPRPAVGLAAQNADKVFCPSLHEYSPSNTYEYVDKSGRTRRKCRACNRDAARARRLKNRTRVSPNTTNERKTDGHHHHPK